MAETGTELTGILPCHIKKRGRPHTAKVSCRPSDTHLGYCLIPSTKGQKMLMLIGKGGEGKSRIGVVMNAIFGLNMNTTSIQKVENNRFARADLEGKLLMVDDDLDMNALTKTNYVKSIVTAELRMDLERKKEQSYQGQLYKEVRHDFRRPQEEAYRSICDVPAYSREKGGGRTVL